MVTWTIFEALIVSLVFDSRCSDLIVFLEPHGLSGYILEVRLVRFGLSRVYCGSHGETWLRTAKDSTVPTGNCACLATYQDAGLAVPWPSDADSVNPGMKKPWNLFRALLLQDATNWWAKPQNWLITAYFKSPKLCERSGSKCRCWQHNNI